MSFVTTGTRRKPSQYNFKTQDFDERLLPTTGTHRRVTTPRRGKVSHIDIHHMTIHDSINGQAIEGCLSTWWNRPASAHYGIDNDVIAQFVYDNMEAWADANGPANQTGIAIEHANSAIGDASGWPISDRTIINSVKLVAGLHVTHKLGRPTSSGFGESGTIRTHHSFYATACPGPYFKKIWADYVKKCQAEYDRITDSTSSPTTPPETNVTNVRGIHWNVAGSDTVNGFGKANAVRGDDVGRYIKEIGFEVVSACEAGQKSLLKGINTILGSYKPWASRAKAMWYRSSVVTLLTSRKVYSAGGFSYLNTQKWGMGMIGTVDGKKFAILEIHTDYRKPAKQAKQIQTIFKKFRADCDRLGVKHYNQVVCGDFNPDGTFSDNPFKALSSYAFEEKGNTTQATFLDGRHLDGVLAHEQAIVEVIRHPRSNPEGKALSDHYPIEYVLTVQ